MSGFAGGAFDLLSRPRTVSWLILDMCRGFSSVLSLSEAASLAPAGSILRGEGCVAGKAELGEQALGTRWRRRSPNKLK